MEHIDGITYGLVTNFKCNGHSQECLADCTDGCVATLIQVRRTDTPEAVPGVEARASLIAYRVLAPRLVLRALPCYGDKRQECEGCALDTGLDNSPRGSAVLRPSTALTLGDTSCCRLRITNITPLPTSVKWEPAIEHEEFVAVTFAPEQFKIRGHSEVDIMVVLEAKKVCHRRLFLRKANVEHTQKPLYLVVDAAVSGVEVVVEFPIGDKETLSFPRIKLTQKNNFKQSVATQELKSSEEIFSDSDRKREDTRGQT
ncbi:uncharacterized protein LOC135193616 [Vanessa tameamea]|uniref:Uncharacterized protein LOC135193616 n=1 Tax=Vanessa tameamea TaxID=334116 RepID=A0ABM4ANN7_VANTA